jgi:ferredoxin
MTPDKEEIRRQAKELGIDLVGFGRWQDLQGVAPDYDQPSQVSRYFTSYIVLAKRYPTGVACSRDAALRQYLTGRVARHLEEAAAELAYWLEARDRMAAVLSAMVPDLRRQPLDYACPAGQGSLLLRQAAVQAGLGSLGLNLMLLTPEFGPRLFLNGLLTDLDLEPDRPHPDELCPGLGECGRCAVACPEAAIPMEGPVASPLDKVRGLDGPACARSSQPYGPQRMVAQLEKLFTAKSGAEATATVRDETTLRLWFNLTLLRQGAFTGCQLCELVCPVGRDYPEIERSSVRRQDLPAGVERRLEGGVVVVQRL